MPLYDVACEAHGVSEVFRTMSDPSPWTCPAGCAAHRHYDAATLPRARVEDTEGIGSERRDGTAGQYLGLPDVKIPVGKDASGRERYAFRPATTSDVPNRKAFLEAAKRAGLSPGDSGRYRTAGQR